MLNVLVVDDDDSTRRSIADALSAAGYDVAQASDGDEAISLLEARAFDLVVSDIRMPKLDGLSLFRRVRRELPGTAVVLMTSFAKIPDVVGTLRDGALDYVTKPFDADEFAETVVGPIAERQAQRQRFQTARDAFVGREAGGTLACESLAMRQLAARVQIVAQSDASVVLVGEPGVGKKLVARTLHAAGPRREGPFLVVPCASLLDLMRESELQDLTEMRARGHRDAWFRAAEGGTLVLEGLEALPLSAHGVLLRVLDEPTAHARRSREWRPLGVRVISVTREDPSTLIDERGFLPALFFRLNATQLNVPSLRSRQGDLYLLVDQILRDLSPPATSPPSLTPRAWRAITTYPFPGNVRELAWALEHALVAASGAEVDLPHLPEALVLASAGEGDPEDGAAPTAAPDSDRPAVRFA